MNTGGGEESASTPHTHTSVPAKVAKHPAPPVPTVHREATIPESPESDDAANRTTDQDPDAGLSPDRQISSSVRSPPSATRVPPQVPRRSRRLSHASQLTHFLESQASAARRSLALKAVPAVTSTTPQFLTVSPAFNVRDVSRSPSPATQIPVSSRARTRHSIDVRNFPSYLQRKRTSLTLGAGKILENLVEVATSPFEPGSPEKLKPLNEPFYEEPEAPVLSLGERVAWISGGMRMPEFGIVKWIGRMPRVCRTWTVGVEFDNAIGSGDGRFEGRRYFTAKENFAKFLPLAVLTRVDHYAGRPRSGTLLSRMSVQLKPGQLISVQRTPSIHHLAHCALNAPHHVDHDVHKPNMEHCLCHNCNHPCAHLCKTAKPKSSDGETESQIAHMCHFSQKPHGKLCCGGEDLLYESISSPKASFNLPVDVTTVLDSIYDGAVRSDNRRHSEISSCRHRCKKTSRSESRGKGRKSSDSSRRSSSLPAPVVKDVAPVDTEQEEGEEEEEEEEDYHKIEREEEGGGEESELEEEARSRSSSELSVASVPSTSTSPVEVYIARGALTDESDVEYDLVPGSRNTVRTVSEMSFAESGHVSSGLRSLVSCLVPGISYQKTGSRNSRGKRNRFRKTHTHSSLSRQVSNRISPASSRPFFHYSAGNSTLPASSSHSCTSAPDPFSPNFGKRKSYKNRPAPPPPQQQQ